jgi:hypothetical protein
MATKEELLAEGFEAAGKKMSKAARWFDPALQSEHQSPER